LHPIFLAAEIASAYHNSKFAHPDLCHGGFAMKAALRVAFLTALSFTTILPTIAQEKSWVGKSVIYNKPAEEIKFGDIVDGKQTYFSFSGIIPIEVRGEREGRLRIHDGLRQGWVDKADFVPMHDASGFFDRRVQANPNDFFALYMRGVSWLNNDEPDKAIKDFDECVRLDPTASGAFNHRGIAWRKKKDYEKAIADYSEAIRLNPGFVLAYYNRGAARNHMQHYDTAIADCNEAIRLDPKLPLAYANRGYAWNQKKDYGKAIADFSETIRLDPNNLYAYNSRAWLWATCPEAKFRSGEKAVESAKKALILDPKGADQMATLAAAYAEFGDFAEAVRWQEKALEDPQFKNNADYRRRLELYRDKKPYRQE
jgi:tetratricopeptide (TPR) repeat protein